LIGINLLSDLEVMPKQPPKIIIISIPLRAEPCDFPPIGTLSIVTALKKAGLFDTDFYNIDLLRPSMDEAIEHIKAEKPDILGISAVVSTAYEYTKILSLKLKNEMPELTIILGGSLGASAEVLLQKTGVDFICTGEGERTFIEFVRCWQQAKNKSDFAQVPGLALFGDDDNLVVTPFPEMLGIDEIYDIEWSILENLGQMEFYISKRGCNSNFDFSFSMDPRSFEDKRKNKTMITLVSSKGCVARCTFCHRWDPGIRYVPVPLLMDRIDYFIEKYNVGFIAFGDENFGSDKRWMKEFLEEMKCRDLLWQVKGMRVSTLDNQLVKDMREAGCATIYCGMESGSQRMLDVMGKVTTVEQNKNAVTWLAENKINTCLQLILGMPGETPETIKETLDFALYYVEGSPAMNPNHMGINSAQALPGTPLYEYGRREGLFGRTLDEEEEYLLKVSDKDARDLDSYMNFTEYPKIFLELWHFEIQVKTRMAFIRKWGIEKYFRNNLGLLSIVPAEVESGEKAYKESGYFGSPAKDKEDLTGFLKEQSPLVKASGDVGFTGKIPSVYCLVKNKKISLIPICYPKIFWYTRSLSLIYVLINCVRKYGTKNSLNILGEFCKWFVFGNGKVKKLIKYISLRKIVDKNMVPAVVGDSSAMVKLRKGR
jgi:anaerobic magnesium-protoporphyrin IX monomethyl ester cyclase